MSRFTQALLAGAVAACWSAMPMAGQSDGASPALERQGDVWIETSGGVMVASGVVALRVDSSGPVTLSGDGGANLTYTVRRTVRAASEAEARQMLERAAEIKLWRSGGVLRLAVRDSAAPSPGEVSTQLRVSAPREVRRSEVRTSWGPVELNDLQGAVTALSGGGVVRCDRIAGSVELRTNGGDIVAGQVKGMVRASTGGGSIRVREAGAEAWLDSGGGEIVVEQALGPVTAFTAAGNVDVGRAASWVKARTNGGLIRVREAEGEVSAENLGGTIWIGSAKGGVRCEAASGAVKLGRVSGEMQVSTGVGSIMAALTAGALLGDSFLSTTRGDVTVMIPSNLAVTVDAMTDAAGRAAKIVSEFSEIRAGAGNGNGGSRARGALNGGGPVLRVMARDGVIYLRRARGEAAVAAGSGNNGR